eukprot:COSAG05_NODE_20296_length_280_cov_1.408840_1_plen_33_part_10
MMHVKTKFWLDNIQSLALPHTHTHKHTHATTVF